MYLDNNATTRPAAEVVEAMLPFLRERFGNPSSVHAHGRAARKALDTAREQVAGLIGCDPKELCFVSSGSEANALALRGVLGLSSSSRGRLVISTIEHPSILELAKALETTGLPVTRVPVGSDGVVRASDFINALSDDVALASLMWANNETGALQPIEEISAACRAKGVLFHVDAVQAAGKVALRASTLCDLMTVSAHKLHGPKGAAALYVRRGQQLQSLVAGHQERGRRGGTEDVAAIVGFGVACELARSRIGQQEKVGALRDQLERGVFERIPSARRNGPENGRLPNTSNLRFEGADGETLLIGLDLEGISASSGAACSSGSQEPSHVLKAMGLSPADAQSSVRFSLSHENTAEEIERLLEVLPRLVERSRP